MADAYKVLQDTSLPRPVRTSVTSEGVEIEEISGQIYGAGEYVLASELISRDREAAENGDLDDFLEPADVEEAEAARAAVATGLHIPEHEVERYALLDAGHRVIERDQVLDLRSAGAEAYRANLEASKEGPNEGNPLVTEQDSFIEVPSITTTEGGQGPVVPETPEEDRVSDEDIESAQSASDAGVEMPPGIPVGPVLARAEGAEPDETDKEAASTTRRASRKKPGSSESESSSSSGSGS